jgi:Cu-Zn family superoxide dismutase
VTEEGDVVTSISTARGVALATAALLLVGAAVGPVVASGATHASARITDQAGSSIGWAKLTEDAAGRLHLDVHVQGLAPGRHGIHLHAIGSCVGPTFVSAGGHVNPLGAEHGLDNPNGAHGGDLPNLVVNVAGRGHLAATSDRATIGGGPLSLLDADGSALVIHANEDDQVTNPTGNSGPRIACGVLQPG